MQTLWARAAQARGSCRCPQCLSSVNGVSRRATGTATRRMPRYLTSSTLWYSGIFAAAATFDAAAKMRRREQWDVAIAGVKTELGQGDVCALPVRKRGEEEQPEEAAVSFQLRDVVAGTHGYGQAATLDVLSDCSDKPEEIQATQSVFLSSPAEDKEQDISHRPTLDRSQLLDPAAVGAKGKREESRAATATYQPFTAEKRQDAFRDIDSDRSTPYWPANTGRPLNVDCLPPQSIYATQGRKEEWTRTTQGPKKLASTQMAVEMLQLNLFRELHRRGWSEEAAKAVPEGFATNILLSETEQIRRIEIKKSAWSELLKANGFLENYVPRQDDVKLCNYVQDRSRAVRKAVYELEQSFRGLFDLHANEELSGAALFAKIAYNLSISPAPNVNTFNTLLLGFSRMGDRAIMDPLIAYIRRAGVRMNEITLATVLKHYTKTNQPKNFSTWIRMMHGKEGGLMLARRDVTIDETSEGRLIRNENNPSKIVQLPYPTPYVFTAVIEGVMRFSGFDKALSICQNMGTSGWGLCISGLTSLLRDCAARADWRAGSAIWTQIQALKMSSRRRDGAQIMSERIKYPTFAAMLKLCSKCQKWDDFNVVWDEALKAQTNLEQRLRQTVEQEKKEAADAAKLEEGNAELVPEGHDHEAYFVMLPNDGPITWRKVPGLKAARSTTRARTASVIEDYPAQHPREPVPSRITQDRRIEDVRGNHRKSGVRLSVLRENAFQLNMEQLHGRLPPSDDLDHYEIAERPWALSV